MINCWILIFMEPVEMSQPINSPTELRAALKSKGITPLSLEQIKTRLATQGGLAPEAKASAVAAEPIPVPAESTIDNPFTQGRALGHSVIDNLLKKFNLEPKPVEQQTASA